MAGIQVRSLSPNVVNREYGAEVAAGGAAGLAHVRELAAGRREEERQDKLLAQRERELEAKIKSDELDYQLKKQEAAFRTEAMNRAMRAEAAGVELQRQRAADYTKWLTDEEKETFERMTAIEGVSEEQLRRWLDDQVPLIEDRKEKAGIQAYLDQVARLAEASGSDPQQLLGEFGDPASDDFNLQAATAELQAFQGTVMSSVVGNQDREAAIQALTMADQDGGTYGNLELEDRQRFRELQFEIQFGTPPIGENGAEWLQERLGEALMLLSPQAARDWHLKQLQQAQERALDQAAAMDWFRGQFAGQDPFSPDVQLPPEMAKQVPAVEALTDAAREALIQAGVEPELADVLANEYPDLADVPIDKGPAKRTRGADRPTFDLIGGRMIQTGGKKK